jgi:nitrogen fixation NifU-like protein
MEQDFNKIIEEMQRQALEELRQQYSETVIDHWMHPRNSGAMTNPDGRARITGPCQDTMEIHVRVHDNTITSASFQTDGCGATIASASMAVELATGKSIQNARAISQEAILSALGGLPVENEHCALLAADTLRAAIDDYLKTKNEPWKRAYRRD